MFSLRFLPLALAAALLALAFPAECRAQIYADVTVGGGVTGTFRITLEHVKTPNAVANFVGLATGQHGWMDANTGAIRSDGFYNGVTFHRVIAGFMSQTGSRAGDGTDGPGYAFKNEIDATLTHNAAYVVAMANSGKDTNGSQWYVTASAQPSLDGGYTIFGHVTSGTAVCDAINAVPTTGSGGTPADRPLTPVTIQSVVISGPSAAGFNVNPASLPRLVNATPLLKKTGATYAIGYDHRTFSEYFGFQSADLATWTRFTSSPAYFSQAAPVAGDVDVTSLAAGTKSYFRMGRADYGTSANLFVPANLASKTLTFPAMFGFVVTINAAGTGGSYTYTGFGGGSGALSTASYAPRPYSGNLFVQWVNGVQMAFDRLEYTSATGGTFAARSNVTGYANVTGTFTSTP